MGEQDVKKYLPVSVASKQLNDLFPIGKPTLLLICFLQIISLLYSPCRAIVYEINRNLL